MNNGFDEVGYGDAHVGYGDSPAVVAVDFQARCPAEVRPLDDVAGHLQTRRPAEAMSA
jgi:hypothetical protein